ncbi:uncharacterized protein CTHT_0013940 [Thermochaetoides thermophila DSM 1495]|uniref:Uncharacterized protein n=1 Tax=Chaetomium thermophilum (strain DSM 1495 / CBS 144.50 / IMI 039719) TaxID=759272 RepID=G0S1K6_CHATD|nr:hypothetical protein CTHT_0013940 [Thermochaetoides thermophila DSM 1495]EGS22916.1 hypothetical protein CTHT_0013940 [Thermochaetoides thermophila DSM 1495]
MDAAPSVGETLSGIFGSVSLTAWICLLLPQLITNYKTKSADALSMKFLLIWLAGDVANLSGALFTTLAPSAIALACYFCINDLILISQCTYYNTINARRRARHQQHHHQRRHRRSSSSHPRPEHTDDTATASSSNALPTEYDPLLPARHESHHRNHHHHPHHHHHHHHHQEEDALIRIITGGSATTADGASVDGENNTSADTSGPSGWVYNTISLLAVWVMGIAGWFVSYKMGAWEPSAPSGPEGGDDSGIISPNGPGTGDQDPLKTVGMVLGARIPQIIKNYRSKSCEGLALLFFLLSLTGNFTYGASVLAYSQERDYLVRAVPWLLGSLGTMVEDCIIFVQFHIYSPHKKNGGDEEGRKAVAGAV